MVLDGGRCGADLVGARDSDLASFWGAPARPDRSMGKASMRVGPSMVGPETCRAAAMSGWLARGLVSVFGSGRGMRMLGWVSSGLALPPRVQLGSVVGAPIPRDFGASWVLAPSRIPWCG